MLGAAIGALAHVLLSPAPAQTAPLPLPDLHGQVTWAAGKRRAPTFTLRNVLGGTESLARQDGKVTLITFLDSRCRSLCPLVGRALGETERALPADARTSVLVVSVDPAGDTPKSVESAARLWRLAPGWHWLTGTRTELAAVWHAYGIEVEPKSNDIVHGAAVYLVDPSGDERAGYLAPLLPNFIALDVRRVESETSS